MSNDSQYPLSDLGDNFDPEVMPDYQDRVKSGEFAKLNTEQIRSIYINEEIDQVHDEEDAENCRRIEEMEDNRTD